VVVKLGGELLRPEAQQELGAITSDVAALAARGDRVVAVHGGGPQTTEMMKRLGLVPNIVAGRRVTDDAALDVLLMVVAGKLNVDLVGALRRAGVSAIGLSGVSAGLILCERRPPCAVVGVEGLVDFGNVGDVTAVNTPLIEQLLDAGHVPVIACVGGDPTGRAYNINADTVANRVGEAVKADRLLLVTNTDGVLRDLKDSRSRIPRMSIAEGRAAIQSGAVSGGMIPKLEESFESLGRGVEQIHVLGRIGPGDLVRATDQPGSVGTALVR
jgi:acetylglutamate kinase